MFDVRMESTDDHQLTMKKLPRGTFEKQPGSGVYWIRYADRSGKIRREVAGPSLELAKQLYLKRKAANLYAKKLPELIPGTADVLASQLSPVMRDEWLGVGRDLLEAEQRVTVEQNVAEFHREVNAKGGPSARPESEDK